MREPGTWDKREVVTPTSFILNLKQIAETWEFDRRGCWSAIHNAMMRLKNIILFLSLTFSLSVWAQRERNYIYVLDCTKSMIGYGGSPKIWDSTRDYLRKELEKHTPGTTLHVVPFQGKVLPSFSFDANNLDWDGIDNQLQKHVQSVTNTNICDAWDSTDKYLDLHKDNYIILLTDGKDNVNGMAAVAKKLSDWCGKYPNTYAFYVQLTEAAIDNGVKKIIDICDNEFVIDASKGIPVFGGFDNDLIIYANTLNLDKVQKIGFSAVGKYAAKAICNDSYFDVKVVEDKIEGGIVPIQIVAKQSIPQINTTLPEIYNFTFDVQSDEVKIINPTVKVQMTNKPERALELVSEESDMGKATWYDSFLFWGASNPDTLSVDLKAAFNNEARKDGSVVQLQIDDVDEEKDFQLFFNSQRLTNNLITLNAEDTSSVLSVVFNPDAKEGKRYFTLKATTKQYLDKINDQPVEQYELTLRSKYNVNWNPLKTVLMWLGILILTALLLWFLLMRHIMYPSIKVTSIQISDPYFCKVNIKGKRRVVFTNQNMQQGLLSRIFTGEILYKKNEIWTSPLAFEAGGKKKSLRVMRTKDYIFDPFTSILKAPSDYIVENTNDNTKIKLTIN